MRPTALLPLILGAALVGHTTAGSSNSAAGFTQLPFANRSGSSGDNRAPTTCTGGGDGNCCWNGTEEILRSIGDLAESVSKLADALKSSKMVKGLMPHYNTHYFRHCSHAYAKGWRDSGVYLVKPDQKEPFEVFCDMETAGGGWTVVQRRVDGSVQFNRTWKDYADGFGRVLEMGEFWLGLEKIHRLTGSSRVTQLRIDLADFEGRTAFAHYSSFAVGTSDTEYKLVLSGYNATSTAGDALSQVTAVSFSTSDNDNDMSLSRINCAKVNQAGWWFRDSGCGLSNLNGRYLSGGHYKSAKEGIFWHYFGGPSYSLKRTEMKILGAD